jgi:hypothetical protein
MFSNNQDKEIYIVNKIVNKNLILLLVGLVFVVGGVAFGDESSEEPDGWDSAKKRAKSKQDKEDEELDRLLEGDYNPTHTQRPARRRTAEPQSPRVKRIIGVFYRTYDKHLKSPDWIKRAMAVISLSRLDDDGVTKRLMDVLTKDSDKYVRVFAWAALLERNDWLTPEQRRKWLIQGVDLALKRKIIHGKLRPALLRAIAQQGPTPVNLKLFRYFFSNTNLLAPADVETIQQLRELLRRWKSKQMIGEIKDMIETMQDPSLAYRAEYVLRGLGTNLKTANDLHRNGKELVPQWKQLQKDYIEWLKNTDLPNYKFEKKPLEAIAGIGLLPGPMVLNPDDSSWRKDLELPSLRVDQLDVAIVMDSTGSMKPAIDWIKRDVIRIMRAMKLISREPAIGVTLYRDEGEEYVARVHKLTSSAKSLGRAIAGASAIGGGDFPEAVYAALYDTLKKQDWPKQSFGHKVVVLVADAPPHRQNMDKIKKLITTEAENGFRFYCLKIKNPDYDKATAAAGAHNRNIPLEPGKAMDEIAKWGEGNSVQVEFYEQLQGDMIPGTVVFVPTPAAGQSPYQQLVAAIFRGMVTEAYRDRVDPFICVLLECLERMPREKRVFKPRRIPRRQPDHHRHKHRPPKDYKQ